VEQVEELPSAEGHSSLMWEVVDWDSSVYAVLVSNMDSSCSNGVSVLKSDLSRKSVALIAIRFFCSADSVTDIFFSKSESMAISSFPSVSMLFCTCPDVGVRHSPMAAWEPTDLIGLALLAPRVNVRFGREARSVSKVPLLLCMPRAACWVGPLVFSALPPPDTTVARGGC